MTRKIRCMKLWISCWLALACADNSTGADAEDSASNESDSGDSGTIGDSDSVANTIGPATTDRGTDSSTGTNIATTAPDCKGGKLDEKALLCWEDPAPAGRLNWLDAVDHCNQISREGYDDWRIPTLDEFLFLLDGCDASVLGGEIGSCLSCADSPVCSSMFGADGGHYWTSSDFGTLQDTKWCVDLGTGEVSEMETYVGVSEYVTDARVRCVRGASALEQSAE